MSLFICSECGCVENTSCMSPPYDKSKWPKEFSHMPNLFLMQMQGYDDGYKDQPFGKYESRMLCSECNTGQWHDEWEKSMPTHVEKLMADRSQFGIYTSHIMYRYNGDYPEGTAEALLSTPLYNELEDMEKKYEAREKQKRGVIHTGGMGAASPMKLSNHYADDLGWCESVPPFVREEPKVGRNDPCPCGSGEKYKRCCYGK